MKKEEAELKESEVRAIAREEYAKQNPTYNTIDEVPAYWREDIREMVEQGIIKGSGGKLGLTRSECKAAVIVKRIREKL